jgi:GDP-4-dehydro-6-deoxy-D-mannose reductase
VRILVTGATGFVGRWLIPELAGAGHDVVPAPSHAELDIANVDGLAVLLGDARPDAVAHLAGITFLPEAESDPELADRVNVGGTSALFEALDRVGSSAAVLVTSTADVYAPDAPLPINEGADLAPRSVYGRTKLLQEAAARRAGDAGRRVVIVRAFNHIGPGQRPVFVVPALARRVLEFKAGRADGISAGNLAARRDFTDVRDVVRAYRLLLELDETAIAHAASRVVNVGSGRSVAIEDILRTLCSIAGVEPQWRLDEAYLRPNEILDRVADTTLLRSLTGWEPRITLETSLRDVLAEFGIA